MAKCKRLAAVSSSVDSGHPTVHLSELQTEVSSESCTLKINVLCYSL